LVPCSISPIGCATKSSVSADPGSIRCTHPEVECIGKGKARAPYEFGCKVSIATPGGQFVPHAKALPESAASGLCLT
jgi:hypothetical protein